LTNGLIEQTAPHFSPELEEQAVQHGQDLTTRLLYGFLTMALSKLLITVGTPIVSAIIYVLSIGYQRRLRIYKLREQGVVSRTILYSIGFETDDYVRQCLRDGVGGSDICWC
jgi:hypothetical protein